MPEEIKTSSLQVNIPEHVKTGVGANIVFVTTTSNGEVILDFIFAHPNDKDNAKNLQFVTLVSRVVLPVKVAKDLNLILGSHLGKPKSE